MAPQLAVGKEVNPVVIKAHTKNSLTVDTELIVSAIFWTTVEPVLKTTCI